jgi:hypothetical protein
MSTFIPRWNEHTHTKTNDVKKSMHLLLLSYKISISICAFLPAFENLKNCLCCRSPFQLLATSFARLLGLPRQSRTGDLSGNVSRARTSGSLRGPNPDCRVDGRSVPNRSVFLCTLKQTGNPTGTNFPISQNLHHLLDRTVPHSNCGTVSLTVILRSCLMISLTFCFLRSVAAVLGRPQRVWSAMSVFPSLKCFIHLLTLLCRHLHTHHEVARRRLLPSFPLL